MTTEPARFRRMLHPVTHIDKAVRFYRDVFGFVPVFVDGDRYASLTAGDSGLDLAGPAEDVTGGVAAAVAKVPDVVAATDCVRAAGGVVVRPPERGPHEVRAVVDDPWGNRIVLYASTGGS